MNSVCSAVDPVLHWWMNKALGFSAGIGFYLEIVNDFICAEGVYILATQVILFASVFMETLGNTFKRIRDNNPIVPFTAK